MRRAVNSTQIRMAVAGLAITHDDLAAMAGVSKTTVGRAVTDGDVSLSDKALNEIVRALERLGARFEYVDTVSLVPIEERQDLIKRLLR